MKNSVFFLLILFLADSCTVAKRFNPNQKIPPQDLQQDYALFRNILETTHPGLYWYTSKDSMDATFNKGATLLQDSLTETKFRNVLSYVIAQIHCGHTSVRPSRAATRYMERVRLKTFPLSLKVWGDTAVVYSSLNKEDSSLIKGALVTAIDGRPITTIIDTFFKHVSADGYNTTHKYQTLSNRGGFPMLYNAIYGLYSKYKIDFVDSAGSKNTTYINLYNPSIDSSKKEVKKSKRISKRERKKLIRIATRSVRMDSSLHTAFMDLNTFTKGYQLPPFFRSSFSTLKQNRVQNLVIDLRGNGGGSVTNSTLLSRFIADKPFKIADSLYAVTRSGRYNQYQQNHFWTRLFLLLMTHRKKDGHYHLNYFERHYFHPKKRNHFTGHVYILTGGNTFSASTLFIHAVKDQKNVTIVGEETGGGAYGNNAWLIPDVTLPLTGVRFRLPLFRLVMDKQATKTGHGVLPDVEALPIVKDIRRSADFKLEKVMELIKKSMAH